MLSLSCDRAFCRDASGKKGACSRCRALAELSAAYLYRSAKVKTVQRIFVVALALVTLEAKAADWRSAIVSGLVRVRARGFHHGFDVNSGRYWVAVPLIMADAFDSAPTPDVLAFLTKLEADPAYSEYRWYLSLCVRGIRSGDRTLPTMLTYPDAGGEWVVFLRPAVDWSRMKPRKAPNQSLDPTSRSVTPPAGAGDRAAAGRGSS
jgi:hypothetical protein